MVCSTNYTDIAFSCTNTTYVDSNGEADGVTVFVAVNCTTGGPLPYSYQDAIYSSIDSPLATLSEAVANETFAFAPGAAALYPKDLDTCNRGCLCGYSPNKAQTIMLDPQLDLGYFFCQCDVWLQYYLSDILAEPPYPSAVLVTAANISLLDHYFVNCTGLVTTDNSTDAKPLQSPLECFGDPLTVGAALFQYVTVDEYFGPLYGAWR